MSIQYEYDQEDWGAQRLFSDDYRAAGWHPVEHAIHYGGNAVTGAYSGIEREMQVLRIYEQAHLSRGWSAIAYNYAVGNSGMVYRLRGENTPGATKGANLYTKAILWIGGLGQVPTAAAYRSMQRIIDDDPMPVYPHSHYRKTQCPGDYWREWIDQGGNMPQEQWHQLIDALFVGAPDEYTGDPNYWKEMDPSSPEWIDFWAAFVRVISR